MMFSVVVPLLAVVLWIEGGPHPRTSGAWLLLGGDSRCGGFAGGALLAVLLGASKPLLLRGRRRERATLIRRALL